ncbi:hypothetical protein GUITHDRAFT_108947 [Guillardia theta CCMP2712]|uniref:Uncharacterized protein n=1 Tax=Guillardia theta (strain CCMP2712) TaxID=905079 RepID=L1J9V0_GUITC|nr:hypothetical protein GUITHDRAFT_108947 [Guillardia theta CCMP2712]EKX45308.1 hypothetical protein GUITHDRAFT_108947 [Guillardia theta CCMP2712]|eukprot:XP_005832288.1 hypothetical protein GUITHDRAFT_108947 [Guillardia theta CCMP2712]
MPRDSENIELHERINRSYELYPLSKDEVDTCRALLTPSKHTSIMVMPTHHINELGEFQGFRFNAGSQVTADVLPISRKMFFGLTMTECISPESDGSKGVNPKAIELLSNIELCKEKIQKVLTTIQQESLHNKASFQCMPVNAYTYEPPEFIGIYHGFTRGFINDIREHKLYIVCSGGLNYAAHDFYNMILDMGDKVTTAELCESEEVHWLRKASQRARAKIIKMVADEFGLEIPVELDMHEHSSSGCYIASPTTETLFHDIQKTSMDIISVYNHSCNTESVDNGILCPMHPCEGIWLFKGSRINYNGYQSYGTGFGTQFICGAFPTGSYPIARVRRTVRGFYESRRDNVKVSTISMDIHQHNVVTIPGSMFELENQDTESLELHKEYFSFDEPFIKNLENMQWNRDNGVVELMPVIVGLG